MKPSFQRLPEKKQQEIMQIVEVIKAVVDPEMVILFGSYAKNKFVEDRYVSDGLQYEYISDYDFLVVTKDSSDRAYTLEDRILEMVDKFEPPVNLEIHSVDFINEGLEWGKYFWVDIINEGIPLFDKGTVKFVEPRVLSMEEKKAKAQEYFDIWFPQASEFLIDAKHAASRGNYKKADFELNQAAENLYYTVLTVFTDYKPKVHNLWKLRKKAKTHSEELHKVFAAETDKNEKRLFELLKQGYIEARYSPRFYVSEEDFATLVSRVSQMISIVEKICQERIKSLQ
ncbi:HEPN domain-containing protein [Paraflavitalea sp. CAU 1676]|uniref:HEPN domain-containing protein n=1 Tax=Paraflavitalea sp. CAU 1676 TaxID=3032598 RepID=UPI0023D9F4DA|nr:HEPN domain-containing protein [Paraflavitalea sp. CAU 1676]MDF2188707.1 HEPN domain-containing protein [Paraflavitalea sp. CAU 1676]